MAKSPADGSTAARRDEFSPATKELLARRAGFRCSICAEPTVGPHSAADRSTYLGEASHIHSAAKDGPRANPALSPEERASASNGIHLCKAHARLIDVDVSAYPAETLRQIKNRHEQTMRALLVGSRTIFDPDFLSSHEMQIIHGRGSPALSDLWVPRHVMQFRPGELPGKRDAIQLLASEPGVILISGDECSGRTSLLKRMASVSLGHKHCAWLNARELTESAVKDPIRFLATGYRVLNADSGDGWEGFLQAAPTENLILIDDLHLSPLNVATKRRFLALLQGLSHLVVVTLNAPLLLELLAVPSDVVLNFNHCTLLDLSRADCGELVRRWCSFGAESIADHELDYRIASSEDQLELLFGRSLMPRHPMFVLTALQMIDAGSPTDTSMGSFGGVYETVIHFAMCKNAPNQAAITSERAYLEELAYWCELQSESTDRGAFNEWFASRKGITLRRVEELEKSLLLKAFVSRQHQGFKFHYQKHYFLASFLRDNPAREGIKEYISKLIANCWNEDFAHTALFLAYLQPSSYLVEAILSEVRRLFADHQQFDIGGWSIESPFPDGFFRGLTFSTDPESNRKLLAQRLDETNPVKSSECETSASKQMPESDDVLESNFFKSFHLVKLMGQLIRNSPIAFDAQQKRDLVSAGFALTLRLVTSMGEVCNPAALKTAALNKLRARVLRKCNRVELEAKLNGLIYHLSVFLALAPIKHACFYLAHPDLSLIYEEVLLTHAPKLEALSDKVLACGLRFELRAPDSDLLRRVYQQLPRPGQDFLRVWTSIFLSYNRVPVFKRQAILQSVEMSSNVQLLLPRG